MSNNRYGAHEALVAPARKTAEIWRLLVGLGVVGLVVFALNTALQTALATLAPDFWRTDFVAAQSQGGTPASMLILLASFGFVALAVAVAVDRVHHRPVAGLLGSQRLAFRQFWRTIGVLLLVGAVLLVLPPYWSGTALVVNLALPAWLLLLPLSLLAVLVQSASEEILFRGYIQQQLAARFARRWVWMALPSGLFALGHYLPAQSGEDALIIGVWAGLFGLLMADLTARAGTLGPAIAVHMANNVSALLFVALPDDLNGLALYTWPDAMSDISQLRAWFPGEFALLFVSWLAARLAIRR